MIHLLLQDMENLDEYDKFWMNKVITCSEVRAYLLLQMCIIYCLSGDMGCGISRELYKWIQRPTRGLALQLNQGSNAPAKSANKKVDGKNTCIIE